MGAIQSSDVLLPKSKPLSLFAAIELLESKIAAVESEMNFYHKLLSWLLLSCHEEKRRVIESFRNELADLREGSFSQIQSGFKGLQSVAKGETGQLEVNADIDNLLMYFQFADGTLQSLKSRIQQGFSDFTHVCIW